MGACSRSARKERTPVASLSQSPAAAAEFLVVRESWEARKVSRDQVEAFLARHPKDGAAPVAKLYLVFLAFEAGQLANADELLASIGELPPGTTRDLATVARARSLRLHGAPHAALDSLRSLVGKVVDDGDREVFLEEIALSAMAAHVDYEAVAYLDAWLRGVGEDDKERVREKIEQVIESLPRKVLEETYTSMRARGAASGYGTDMQKIVAERLARIAVQTNDAALARWLVDQSGVSAAQTGGDAGVELGELAASRRGIASFAGRTVGLLVPTRDRELRDEAADVVRGISWALDLPRRAGVTDGVRLVTRDDGVDEASTNAALEELEGEGAGVMIAGLDRASADRAVVWSEKNGVPVLLLTAPSAKLMPQKYGVVLGDRLERELTMLGQALVRHGAKTAAFVASADDDVGAAAAIAGGGLTLLPAVRCDVPLAEAGRTRFPIDAWTAKGARGFLVSGSGTCARDVLRDVGSRTAPVALTLEAGVPLSDVPKGVTVLSAAAGIIPVLTSKPDEVQSDEVRRFMESLGVRPSWWSALGHDAGVLAKAALQSVPTSSTVDPEVITQRRALVQTGLLATRVALWTSEEQQLKSTRILDRTLSLVTWQRDKR
ncbi:MAG: hypothetical protein KIT84_02655 [Labilithrix sp.]|nr:hypothetical protein [Labilithrix sp.]MCW5809881.1 hypothetical protein [Labilithrix sp.]